MAAPNGDENHLEQLRLRGRALHASLEAEMARLNRIITRAFPAAKRAEPAAGTGLPVTEGRQSDQDAGEVLMKLTSRERQVLKCIAEGLSTKQTAATLGIRFKTAACHRHRIMQKLNVHETTSLVRIAIRAGMVKL